MVENGIPQPMVDQFVAAGGSGNALDLTGTGDLGQRILDAAGPLARPFIEPILPQLVASIQGAFAIAIASTFWIGIGAAVIAAIFVLFVRDPAPGTFMATAADAREGAEA
jgi:hypothetical protein